ncbi:MAG: glycine--tRNA ligase subunit beta [Smithellaceae bacterium]|nr:glycine--tRNA ligase subunit beta [Smithellaceae bacterium]
MGKELLLEIGTEEIPAAFLPKAIRDMDEIISREFAARRIAHGEVKTMATPRRLVLCISDVAGRQDDQVVEKLGPAKRVAFDEQGNPTKALAGFAKGQGMDIAELMTVTTDKGEYLCARKQIKGEDTSGLLPEILAKFVTQIPFRKSMRWADLQLRFARPIHWILALYGGKVVEFQLENIKSGGASYGHRFMSPGEFAVANFADYLQKAKENFVIVDPEERRHLILEQARAIAKERDGVILENEDLIDQVAFLTEFPNCVGGSFDPDYLKLPQEVLITSMISHQKYFPVTDEKGKLLNYFITVNNTRPRDPEVVKRGNEKVIRARLSDARFFFDEDRKTSLESRVEGLKNVTFHSLLGTSFDKVARFRKLASFVASRVMPELAPSVDRAAYLAKADLDTQMVCEFTELQGIMGREYALLSGEKPEVAKAIYEHYLPTQAGGELPETHEGAIVSIADKTDTICGFFGVNLIPTGTADPYALRRQALGIINIILQRNYPLTLDELVGESLTILKDRLTRPADEVKADVLSFFRGRFENQLITQGHPYDVVDAVLETGSTNIPRVQRKIEAMEDFKKQPEFEPLAIGFKRVGNIIKGFSGGHVDPKLFETAAERDLHGAFLAAKNKVLTLLSADDYTAALTALAGLRGPVDAFFDGVMVMAEDEQVRFNRLSLLEEISDLFHHIADFGKIQTES